MNTFVESSMTFGPYPDGHCFRLEQSATYKSIQNKVKIAEFLLLKKQEGKVPSVWIIEAKESAPRPGNKLNFDEFICDIREKLSNSLAVGIASILKRHLTATTELPALFQSLDLATTDFRLVLVVNGHQKSWLQPLQDALRNALHATVKSWALGPNAVAVINQEDAKQFGLISMSAAQNNKPSPRAVTP